MQSNKELNLSWFALGSTSKRMTRTFNVLTYSLIQYRFIVVCLFDGGQHKYWLISVVDKIK